MAGLQTVNLFSQIANTQAEISGTDAAPIRPDFQQEPISAVFSEWSGRQDSNLRPTVPKTVALPNCATPRSHTLIWNIVDQGGRNWCG